MTLKEGGSNSHGHHIHHLPHMPVPPLAARAGGVGSRRGDSAYPPRDAGLFIWLTNVPVCCLQLPFSNIYCSFTCPSTKAAGALINGSKGFVEALLLHPKEPPHALLWLSPGRL